MLILRLLFIGDYLPTLTETAPLYSLRYSKILTVESKIKVPPTLRSVA